MLMMLYASAHERTLSCLSQLSNSLFNARNVCSVALAFLALAVQSDFLVQGEPSDSLIFANVRSDERLIIIRDNHQLIEMVDKISVTC